MKIQIGLILKKLRNLPYKSKTSWQKFRDTGTIKFSQPKHRINILYSRKSIVDY